MNLDSAPGLHYETAKAMLNKRDPHVENIIFQWMSAVLGEKVPALGGTPYEDELANGVVLCKLMNKLKPESVRNIDMDPKHAFKEIENIAKFLRAAQKFGVKEGDLFQTTDLTEKRNIPQVTNCILAVARACYLHPEYKGPFLGPKPAEANPREFSEETLKHAAGLGYLAL